MTTASTARTSRGRGLTVTALVLAAAVLIGLGTGGTLALWRDEVPLSGKMPLGVTVFGVGAPAPSGTLATYATADGQSLDFTFGPAQAAELYGTTDAGGSVAIPVQVDSLAQGHRGLHYTVATDVSGGVFGASTWELLKLAPGAQCSPDATGAPDRASTPWAATYDTTSTLRSEHWCLVARYVPVAGTHEGTATVTATPEIPDDPAFGTLTDSDTWRAAARETLDPTAEPTHSLTFTFTTFRPGAAP